MLTSRRALQQRKRQGSANTYHILYISAEVASVQWRRRCAQRPCALGSPISRMASCVRGTVLPISGSSRGGAGEANPDQLRTISDQFRLLSFRDEESRFPSCCSTPTRGYSCCIRAAVERCGLSQWHSAHLRATREDDAGLSRRAHTEANIASTSCLASLQLAFACCGLREEFSTDTALRYPRQLPWEPRSRPSRTDVQRSC